MENTDRITALACAVLGINIADFDTQRSEHRATRNAIKELEFHTGTITPATLQQDVSHLQRSLIRALALLKTQ